MKKSNHFDGKKFFNPGLQINKGFRDLLKWQLEGGREAWPAWLDDNAKPEVISKIEPRQANLIYINHATYLIQLPNLNILTDPVFSNRVSPVSWAGPKRHRSPGLEIKQLPSIDVVLISHNHYDHMDRESLIELQNAFSPQFITPLGNNSYLEKWGIQKVTELDWWEAMELKDSNRIHLAPAQHWSARSMFDTNQALWGAFVVESNGLKIYFGGDTGYGPHFKATKEKFGPMDISLLPIGAYEPRWFMKEQHMDPEEAVQAHFDLASDLSFGIHFGTFQLTNEAVDRPAQDLKKSLEKAGIPLSKFRIPRNGQSDLYEKRKEPTA